MSTYRKLIAEEIAQEQERLKACVKEFESTGGINSPRFYELISLKNSIYQSIKAKKERIQQIGRPRPFMPDSHNQAILHSHIN